MTVADDRIIAIDWSGARVGERRKIWLAEARVGRLVRLEAGRTRAEVVQELVQLRRAGPEIVVGLDFAFSFPAWFLRQTGCGSAGAMWEVAARDGEQWLARCGPPFWGRAGKTCRVPPERRYRLTDRGRPGAIRPKSVFQVGGAGAVGTGSIRGMPFLTGLREAGFAIWPFDAPRAPLVVEIYPRLLAGAVVKSRRDDRDDHLKQYQGRFGLDASLLELAASCEDAFDAAVSAVEMAQHADEFRALPRATDPIEQLEGRIWAPAGALA